MLRPDFNQSRRRALDVQIYFTTLCLISWASRPFVPNQIIKPDCAIVHDLMIFAEALLQGSPLAARPLTWSGAPSQAPRPLVDCQ